MRQKNRDSQSLIPNPLSLGHEHGLSVSTDSKTRKGRSIHTTPLFFYNDFAAHFSAKTGLPCLFHHRSRDDHPQREPPHFLHIEQQGVDDKYRVQDQYRPADIREESGHLDAILFCDRLDHEIRCIADIRIGPMKTAPAEIASSMSGVTVPTVVAMPSVAPRLAAVCRKTR